MLSIMYAYYRNQNSKNNIIGGKISKAKTFWLGYAMFHYFILPWWFLVFVNQNADHSFAIYTILGIFYFRMLLQMLLMFVTRNWSPVIGITYNIVASVIFIYLSIHLIGLGIMPINYMIIIYILNLIAILLTDTYYARSFHLLVGEETKGKTAIWFASDEEKFKPINRITARNNVIFILVSLVMLLLLLIYDIY